MGAYKGYVFECVPMFMVPICYGYLLSNCFTTACTIACLPSINRRMDRAVGAGPAGPAAARPIFSQLNLKVVLLLLKSGSLLLTVSKQKLYIWQPLVLGKT